MGTIEKRSRQSKKKSDKDVDLKLPEVHNLRRIESRFNFDRKCMLVILIIAIIGILLIKSYNFDVEEKKSRRVPDPENPQPPSPSILHSFSHAAVSSDSQVCSDIAR